MYLDIKYLTLLSPRLSKFKQKGKRVWNFRCNYCGDSQRNKNKARGFVFELKGELMYKCHNCGISHPVSKLIQDMDPQMYKEYRMEKFQDGKKTPDMRKVKKVISSKPVFKRDVLSGLSRLDELNTTHVAREYIDSRKLPTEALYYTEKFKEWTNSLKPNTFQDITQDEGRIIIPFRTKEGNVFGYQGRSISASSMRYITIILEEGMPKVFGLDKVDYGKTIYITEGPFDSLLLDNAIAMAGADVSSDLPFMDGSVVYIYDNEPRNKQIIDRMSKHIDKGHQIVIWPDNISAKDPNDMHLGGYNVQNLVESNIYSGLSAKLKLNQWKK